MSEKLSGNVLIVDDEKFIRDVCERALSSLGLHIKTAPNADEATKLLKKDKFDFVLTDIIMPGSMDGQELVYEIINNYPQTDVVVMTGYPTLDTAIPVLRKGASDYIVKPFDKVVLTAVVEKCLKKRRLSQELQHEKILRKELESAYSELQKVERVKEGFLARINHELKTPLVPSFLVIETLKEEISSKHGRKLLNTLYDNMIHLDSLIENLLNFTEITGINFKFKKREKIVLADLINKIIKKYNVNLLERDIHLKCLFSDEPLVMEGSLTLMETAIKHVLLNAIQFSSQKGTIEIKAIQEDKMVCISFKDNGIGIPSENIHQIYDTFYQAADYLTRETGGLGLGLAIVRRILELHNGRISVESQEGKGSEFHLFLPAYGSPIKKSLSHTKEFVPSIRKK